jgi:hypothetical protein
VTREEFVRLPPEVALGLVYDQLHSALVTIPSPTVSAPAGSAERRWPARPPRFETRLPRKGGYQLASETLLESLEWFREKKLEGAASNGKYADKDRRLAAELEIWIGWRAANPGARWEGTRNGQQVTAELPSRDPTIHPWPSRGPAKLDVTPEDYEQPQRGDFSEADYGPRSGDEEIPF